jgi:hypothetical protein
MIYFLISDEVYREFTYDGDVHYSVMRYSWTWRACHNDWFCIKTLQHVCAKNRMYHIKTKSNGERPWNLHKHVWVHTIEQIASKQTLDTPSSTTKLYQNIEKEEIPYWRIKQNRWAFVASQRCFFTVSHNCQ